RAATVVITAPAADMTTMPATGATMTPATDATMTPTASDMTMTPTVTDTTTAVATADLATTLAAADMTTMRATVTLTRTVPGGMPITTFRGLAGMPMPMTATVVPTRSRIVLTIQTRQMISVTFLAGFH